MKDLRLTMGLFGRTLVTLALTSMSAFANLNFNFICISSAADCQNDVGNQLNLNVSQTNPFVVDFKFTNNGGIDSSITGIYFIGTNFMFFGSPWILPSGAGVDFRQPVSPENLPDSSLNWHHSFHSEVPVVPNGINTASEFATAQFLLAPQYTFEQILVALGSGSAAMEIGVHIEGLPGGQECVVFESPRTARGRTGTEFVCSATRRSWLRHVAGPTKAKLT